MKLLTDQLNKIFHFITVIHPAPIVANYNLNFGVYAFILLGSYYYYSSIDLVTILFYNKDITSHILFCYINSFLTVFIPLLLIFAFYSSFIILNTFKQYYNTLYFIIPLSIISLVFYFSPFIMLIFSLLISGFLINLIYAPFFTRWVHSKLSSTNMIIFLNDIGFLSFFFKLFYSVFVKANGYQFILIALSSHLLGFFYILLSRYLMFFTFVIIIPFPWYTSILLLLCIFICLIALLFRILINVSVVLVSITGSIQPSLWDSFLLSVPTIDPEQGHSQTNAQNVPSNRYGWFNRIQTTNHNYYQATAHKLSIWKGLGYTIGACTLLVSCWIGYHTQGAHVEARKQTLEAQKQTVEAQEANRLKRIELARANPKQADIIFEGHPEEYNAFKNKK